MGENFGNKDFRINDDGTIVRGWKCPKCGKESYSEGTHCEHCGARIDGNASTPKDGHNWWIWLLLMFIIAGVAFGVVYLSENNSNDFEWVEDSISDAPTAVEVADTTCVEEYGTEEVACVEDYRPSGYVDLGLPSGTLWKEENETGFYEYEYAIGHYGNGLPTRAQWEELEVYCEWTWTGDGYWVRGPNNYSIVLPAAGDYPCDSDGNKGDLEDVGTFGNYWSSYADDNGFDVYTFSIHKNGFHSGGYGSCGRYGWHSVRLVYNL